MKDPYSRQKRYHARIREKAARADELDASIALVRDELTQEYAARAEGMARLYPVTSEAHQVGMNIACLIREIGRAKASQTATPKDQENRK